MLFNIQIYTIYSRRFWIWYQNRHFVYYIYMLPIVDSIYGGTVPLAKNKHVLCSISKLSTLFFLNIYIYPSYSKLSKELKNGIEILVDQAVLSYGSNSQNDV